MFGLDKCLKKLDADGTPIRTSVVGAGFMGGTLASQVNTSPGMEIDVVVDLKLENAVDALKVRSGIDEKNIAVCNSIADAEKALKSGKKVCSTNPEVAWAAKQIDVVVEATGVPAAYAHIALNAIRNKKHVVALCVEGDVCIGHILKMFADNAGVIYTGIYGDEPGNMMALYSEAAALGLEIVAVGRTGKGGGKLDWNKENIVPSLEAAGLGDMNPAMFASFCDLSKTNEECCAMANATGLRPDIRGMHGPCVSFDDFITEVPRLMQLKENGGILNHIGVVEQIEPPGNTLFSPNIWVFVVVRATNPFQRRMIPGRALGDDIENRILYSTYHMVAVQAPITIAVAMIDHRPVIEPLGNKRAADTITIAKKDLEVGETIDEIGGFCSAGRIEVASIARNERLLPYALAEGARMKRAVPQGAAVSYDDVEIEDDQALIMQLRNLQHTLFGDLY